MNSKYSKKLSENLNRLLYVTPAGAGLVGLCSNTLGAIILAISLTSGDGYQESMRTGIEYHYALVSDIGVKVGIYLFVFGSVLQVIEKINFKKSQKVSLPMIVLVTVFLYFVSIIILPRLLFL